MTKFCNKCKQEKDINDFPSDKSKKDLHTHDCRVCHNEHRRAFYSKNSDKLKEYVKRWYKDNTQKARSTATAYVALNKDNINKRRRIYRNNRNLQDIGFFIKEKIRKRILCCIERNSKSNRTIDLLGCSILELKNHLGVIGNKYDSKKYHIDHIIPCNLFNLTKESEQLKCFNYRNLRLIDAKENIIKSDTLDIELVRLYQIEDLLPRRVS
jgi:hypothetical protein